MCTVRSSTCKPFLVSISYAYADLDKTAILQYSASRYGIYMGTNLIKKTLCR